MTLKEIKKNIDPVQKYSQKLNVDTNSILLLSMAQALILLVEKDGNNGESELLKNSFLDDYVGVDELIAQMNDKYPKGVLISEVIDFGENHVF